MRRWDVGAWLVLRWTAWIPSPTPVGYVPAVVAVVAVAAVVVDLILMMEAHMCFNQLTYQYTRRLFAIAFHRTIIMEY